MPMRILVTGSRHWTDEQVIFQALDKLTGASPAIIKSGHGHTVVNGGCPTGADFYARRWAGARGAACITFYADWAQGRRAGPLRNQKMVDAGADVCVAFPLRNSPGTEDCMRRAEKAGLPLWVKPL
jgi:hypothetical protein